MPYLTTTRTDMGQKGNGTGFTLVKNSPTHVGSRGKNINTAHTADNSDNMRSHKTSAAQFNIISFYATFTLHKCSK